jgi:propanol-preferring alcohol dehydrogenase
MRAVQLVEAGRDPVLTELPVPSPAATEVRVAMRACGICGSDVHIIEGRTAAAYLPLVLGHEAAGVVDAIGAGVDEIEPGARVLIDPMISCGVCKLCSAGATNLCPSARIIGLAAEGAHAEYVVVPRHNVHRLPDTIDFALGAILADAVATPLHAVDVSGVQPGQTVAIFGLGGLGLHAALILQQLLDVDVIGVDANDHALDRAASFGVKRVYDARQPRVGTEIARHGGVDVAFEFAGSPAVVDEALRALRHNGTCVVVGLSPDRLHLGLRQETFVGRGLRLQGSLGYTAGDIERLICAVASGTLDISGSITHTFPLGEYLTGLDTLRDPGANAIRVVITND